MTVLITGGSGPVGTAIADHLSDQYELVNLDIRSHPHPDVRTVEADATDYDAIRPHFEGVDDVVHLTRVRFPDEEKAGGQTAGWSKELAANLESTANVFRAASEAGVDRFVFGSSNHVVGMYEYLNKPEIYYPGFGLPVDHTVPVRPDSMYGVWKVYGEAIGRMCAAAGGPRFYGLRICNVTGPDRETPVDYAEHLVEEGADPDSAEVEHSVRRKQAMWHSRRDLAHLVDCCLRDESVTADVFYGVSDNPTRWFDIEHARDVLGYDPQDDASDWPVLDG